MGKREKLIDRLTRNPQSATFADLRNLLEYEAFHLDSITTNYHIYKYAEITLVVPANDDRAKSIYVTRVLEIVAQSDPDLEEEE
jgi:hypothetical protein